MASDIKGMLEVAKNFKIGDPININGYEGIVKAFSDEHLFAEIPEVALRPDEIDIVAKVKRDQYIESLRRELHSVQRELERMLNDREYADQRQREARRRRDWDRNRYDSMDYGITGMRPSNRPMPYKRVADWKDEGSPSFEKFIDELQFRKPTQQK